MQCRAILAARFLAILLILAGAPLRAADDAVLDGPMSFGHASFKLGKIHVRSIQIHIVEARKTVIQGGQKVDVKYIRPQWVKGNFDIDVKKIKLLDSSGKEVAAKDVAGLLEKERRVVITSSGKLDPFFAPFLKPGTYQLVIPME